MVYLSISPAVLMYSTKTKPSSFQKKGRGGKKKGGGGENARNAELWDDKMADGLPRLAAHAGLFVTALKGGRAAES